MSIVKLNCKIYLKKKDNKIEIDKDGILKIYLNAIREKGKANKAIIEIISNVFLIKKYNISIISGFTTINKIIEIKTNKTKEELLAFLN